MKHYHTLTRDGSCVFAPLVIERESLAMGPATLELVDKIVVKSKGIAAQETQPRFTIIAKILIAACIGNAVLVDQALRKDEGREGSRFRQVNGPYDHDLCCAATLRAAG